MLLVVFFRRRDEHQAKPVDVAAKPTPLLRSEPICGQRFPFTQSFLLSTGSINTFASVPGPTPTSPYFAREQRQDPSLPVNFPFNRGWFEGGLHSGILGPFFMPEKTIFLFDPMFPLGASAYSAFVEAAHPGGAGLHRGKLVMVAAYVVFYARYNWWAGDFAWGDRYISSAVQFSTLLAIPLLLRYRKVLGRAVWYLGLAVTGISVAIQCASLAFWVPLRFTRWRPSVTPPGWSSSGSRTSWHSLSVSAQPGGWTHSHVSGFVGCRPHNHLELSPLLLPAHWPGATVGRPSPVWRLGGYRVRSARHLSKAVRMLMQPAPAPAVGAK